MDQAWSDNMVPVAKKIFKAIAERIDSAPMSTVAKTDEAAAEWSKEIVGIALQEMLAADMRVRDDVELLKLMIQLLAHVMDRVKQSLDMNYDTAIAKVFGAQNQHAVTMKQLHEVLMKPEA